MTISKQSIEEEAVKLVQSTKKHFEQLRKDSGKTAEWLAAENSYFNGTKDFYDGVAKIRVPVLHQAVERIVPKMDKVVFPPDGEFFAAQAKDHKDDISVEDAEAVTALVKQQFNDVEVRSKLIGVDRSLATYGTVFLTTFWDKKVKRRFKRVEGVRTEVWDTVFDNPDFYSPSIWDVYIDPRDENLQGDLIERVVKNYHELFALRKRKENGEDLGIYDNVDQLKELSLKQEEDSEKKESQERIGLGNHQYGPNEQKIELLKFWGNVPTWLLTGKEEDRENKLVVENALIEVGAVGDKAVLLRIIDNPFDHVEKPYIKGRYLKVDGQAYGLGVMSVNIPLEAELNTLRSQLMDLRSFILKKKWLVDRQANIDESQLKDLHNSVIYTDDLSGMKDVAPIDFGASALPQEQIIKQDVQDSTGASKLLSGTPSGSSLDRTAAGVATVVSGGLERFELVVTQFQEDVLKPLVRHFWQLDQQFLPEGRDVALVGRRIIRVNPSEIPLEGFDLNFLGIRELGEKEFKVNALNIAMQNIIPFAQYGLDPTPIPLELLKLLGLGHLTKEIDKRPETQLEETPEGEVQLLQLGKNVRINLNDDHIAFLKAYEQLTQKQFTSDPITSMAEYATEFIQAIQASQLPENVKVNLREAVGQRLSVMRMTQTGVKTTPNVE